MAVPKRKMSKMKLRSRRSSHKAKLTPSKPCPQCGAAHQSHRVCPACGYYRGRQVLSVETK